MHYSVRQYKHLYCLHVVHPCLKRCPPRSACNPCSKRSAFVEHHVSGRLDKVDTQHALNVHGGVEHRQANVAVKALLRGKSKIGGELCL